MSSNQSAETSALRPQELNAVYAISRAVAQSVSLDSALDEIVRLARPVFIFDNMVLYIHDQTEAIEPAYAQVIGRGQSAEGELAWGDMTANEVIIKGEKILRYETLDGWENDRLSQRYFLGLPLKLGDTTMGALVFGRFGGPPFEPDQIHLAEYIAIHVAQVLSRKQLLDRIVSLEAERRLERLQQDFIATISHELCTPLGFIKGYATTLLREDTTWDDETRKEFLSIIDEEADRLRELIDNLLDSSRLQSGTLRMHFQPARLDSLLRDISVRVHSRNSDLNINLDIRAAGIRCTIDPTRIAQVLDNLLTNASKYAPGSPVTILLEENGDQIHIAVQDGGPGISPDHLENIFKRFYRVPELSTKARGTGLGLFICREIINAHNGEITVESELNKGTTFHIYLPYIKE